MKSEDYGLRTDDILAVSFGPDLVSSLCYQISELFTGSLDLDQQLPALLLASFRSVRAPWPTS